MVLTATIGVALALTLLVPIYPNGMEPLVLVFLALVGAAGVLGLASRSARRELMVLSLWAIPVALGMFVGSVRHPDAQQILEDSLPYALFVLGVLAGRATTQPRFVLLVVMLVCFFDGMISLVKVAPHYAPGFRSSYLYTRIVAGLPLLGMFVLAFLRRYDRESGRRRTLAQSPLALVAYLLMLLAVLASVSRGMMLGWAAGVAIAAYLRSPSRVLLMVILATFAYVAYSSVVDDFGVRYLRAGEGETISGRVAEISTALDEFVRHPLFGSGLGTFIEADGTLHSYVHNLLAYHLWKFGLVGSALLATPLLVMGAQIRRYSRPLRAAAIGGAAAVFLYLVTCASYKTYFLVWMYGVTAGAVLTALWQWHTTQRAALLDGPGAD